MAILPPDPAEEARNRRELREEWLAAQKSIPAPKWLWLINPLPVVLERFDLTELQVSA